jgi:hypothetical protein
MRNLQWVVHAAQVSEALACLEEGCGHAKKKHSEEVQTGFYGPRLAYGFCRECGCTKFK